MTRRPFLCNVVVAIILYICIGLKQAQVFILGVAVGHARQVVADRALQRTSQRPPRVTLGELLRNAAVFIKQRPQEAAALGVPADDTVVAIDTLVTERLHSSREAL